MSERMLYTEGEYHISQDESERLRILKLWLAIMVVFIHSYSETINFTEGQLVLDVPVWLDWMKCVLSHLISQCAVPGFFLISAIFLYRKDFTWAGNLRKKVRTLLIPYLLINTAWIVIFYVVQHIGALSPYFSREENIVANWTIVDFLNAYAGVDRVGQNTPIVGPLWFMRDLMLLNVLAIVIKKVIDRFPRIIFLLLTAMELFGIETYIPVLSRDAIVFFALGYYLVKYGVHVGDVDKLDPVLLVGLYGICLALEFSLRDMPQAQIVRPFSIIFDLVFFMRFTTKVKDPVWKRKLLHLSGYAVPVYLFHQPALMVTKKLMGRFLPTTTFFQVVEYFGIPVVIITLCVAGSWLLRRWTPRLYAVLTGGRTM